MKLSLFSLRTPLIEFRSALARSGFRTQEDYEELVRADGNYQLRLSLRSQETGHIVQCSISVDETRLRSSAIELFNDLCVEGRPVVSYGAGRGQFTFEFEWYQLEGLDWSGSVQRLDDLIQRMQSSFAPRPTPARRAQRQKANSHLLDGVLARAVTAA
jgi:hypothetical protein